MVILQELFLCIVNMSITAALVIGAVLILRLMLCRAPKKYSYLLWGIVLFRLLCPVSPPSDFSALNLTKGWITEQGRMEYFTDNRSGELTASVTLDPGINGDLPSDGRTASSETFQAVVSFQQRALPPLAAVWLLGAAGMAVYSIFTMVRLRQKLECSVRVKENIYLADHISTPFVLGALHPRIYLPHGLEEQEQSYILLHEQYHISRRDYLMKPLAFLALCIHWFNPLVWLAFCLAGKDMEMSCDEAVMKKIDGDVRKAYAGTLLHLSGGRGGLTGAPLAFGRGNPQKRIKNVMRYRKPAAALSIAAAAILVIAAAGLLTNPASAKGTDDYKAQAPAFAAGTDSSFAEGTDPASAEEADSYKAQDSTPAEPVAEPGASSALPDTDAVINHLLEEICSEPGISSNPQDYIAAHEPEYRELCYYGDFTVRCFLKRFETGNETGLEGQVMARVCKELLGLAEELPAEITNGQEWYEALKAYKSTVVEEYLH